jgi:hypothetical protein
MIRSRRCYWRAARQRRKCLVRACLGLASDNASSDASRSGLSPIACWCHATWGGGSGCRIHVIPAIPAAGLAPYSGTILAVRIFGPCMVSGTWRWVPPEQVPKVGMARTIRKVLAVRLLGYRRTCRTNPTDPMIQLNPVDRMACPADGSRRREPTGARACEFLQSAGSGIWRCVHRQRGCGRPSWIPSWWQC